MSPPKIAIIGAGPAGLTLARLLHTQSSSSNTPLSITIFEKDASATSRVLRGGTLDLHDDTGLKALQIAGLFNEFQKHARYDAEALVIADKNGTRLIDIKGATQMKAVTKMSRPEIDRSRLQDLLLESVPPEFIKWGYQLRSVSEEDGNLVFDNGERVGGFDLVIGADGAWSKVRPVLTDVRPSYSGICGFEMRIADPDRKHPELSKMVGRGSYFAYGDCKSMTAQRLGDETIKIGTWAKEVETFPQDLMAQHDREGVKRKLLERYADWAPAFHEWLESGDAGSINPWTLYELPLGHTWKHKKGYTMLSDAAHLMTPFAGEGVNAGMRDALELAEAIIHCQKAGGDLDAAMRRYEKDLFPRAATVMAQTNRNKVHMFGEDGAVGFMMAMKEYMDEKASDISPILGWLSAMRVVTALFYCYLITLVTVGRLKRHLGAQLGSKQRRTGQANVHRQADYY